VAVNDGIEGFIRRADLSRDRAEQRPERFSQGDRVDAPPHERGQKWPARSTCPSRPWKIAKKKEAGAQFGSTDFACFPW
jgi:Ribosomal protein S1